MEILMYGYSIAIASFLALAQSPFLDKTETNKIKYELPKIESEALKKIIFRDNIKFYDKSTMPLAYQDFTPGALQGIHSPTYNISANRSEPFGNGNIEFPWGKPAGTHRISGLNTTKFITLPKDSNGDILPIIYWNNPGEGYEWQFPHGTVIGEILYHENTCFEIRTRIRNEGKWNVDVYRPYASHKELQDMIIRLFPNYKDDAELLALYNSASKVDEDLMVLEDTQPNKRVFLSKVKRVLLPGISKDKAKVLLANKPFKSVMGASWTDNADSPPVPTVTEGYGIVPAKYDGDFVEVSSKSCARCHDSVNVHVRNFDFGRDWYGKVRGSDGIFSFHIFDPSCISYNGIGNGVRIRQDLIDDGWLVSRPAVLRKSYYSDLSKQ